MRNARLEAKVLAWGGGLVVMKTWRNFSCWILLAGLWCLALAGPAWAAEAEANYLDWRISQRQVSARVTSWPLYRVLAQISATTGWEVFLEPGVERSVTVEFKDLSPEEALGKLLGQLNYSLLPQKGAPAKLFVFSSSAAQATERVQAAAPTETKKVKSKIPGELVVVLKPGSKESIEAIAKRLGAKVVGRIDGLNAYRLQFTDDAAAESARVALASDANVASVDYNYTVDRPTQMQSLGPSTSPAVKLKVNSNPDPNRLVIGLIDTAVQAQAAGIKDFMLKSLSVAEGTASSDALSHGTAMAETILRGISMSTTSTEGTTTRILSVDVYGSGESTSTFAVAQGIVVAINSGATIINLSLGSDGASTFLQQVIQEGHAQGVVFVGAAGNQPTTAATYPAAYSEVIATTARDAQGNLASYANRGSFVDVIAPGGSVVDYNSQAYYVVGTSAAAAYVSGMTAGVAATTGKSASQAEGTIRDTLGYKASP